LFLFGFDNRDSTLIMRWIYYPRGVCYHTKRVKEYSLLADIWRHFSDQN
jgi:hypothetical protein